jgi:hypothetical protein
MVTIHTILVMPSNRGNINRTPRRVGESPRCSLEARVNPLPVALNRDSNHLNSNKALNKDKVGRVVPTAVEPLSRDNRVNRVNNPFLGVQPKIRQDPLADLQAIKIGSIPVPLTSHI